MLQRLLSSFVTCCLAVEFDSGTAFLLTVPPSWPMECSASHLCGSLAQGRGESNTATCVAVAMRMAQLDLTGLVVICDSENAARLRALLCYGLNNGDLHTLPSAIGPPDTRPLLLALVHNHPQLSGVGLQPSRDVIDAARDGAWLNWVTYDTGWGGSRWLASKEDPRGALRRNRGLPVSDLLCIYDRSGQAVAGCG